MKILFITWTRIGDAVLSTGLLHELVRRHPEARITVVCGPLAASLFAGVPGLTRVIALHKRALNAHWFKLWRDVAGERWDLVVDLRRSLTGYFLRAGRRAILGPADDSCHRVAWLPRLLGVDAPLAPRVWIGAEQHAAAAALMPAGRTILAIAPVAARADKTWPAEAFAALTRRLLEGPCAGWRVLVVAGPGEEPQFAPLIAAIPPAQRTLLIGHADLLVVAAALARARLFIGNDSGMTHLAAAAGAPTMALFGPTNPAHYGPWGDHACVVEAPATEGVRRMSALGVEAVADAVSRMLAHTQGAGEAIESRS